ncbi:hypothetical protein SAMN05444366_4404 [Flavobacterium saccharophilum]|uniref:Uncharacterized protein n=2 Tax=Flavobacterium saccharophilum TaxID=29534 RepID=A0A1M7M853_9FLAO|nr:hypothetical protein SAMN05444366_4404 [Flavobacterium saccharophilum]
MRYKRKIKLEFHEEKWFKLICFFVFFGWLLYIINPTFQINKNELVELDVTVYKEWKTGGQRNPVKLSFTVKEYSNRFGIYVGGTYGRWTEVTETLVPNRKIKIKIHKSNKHNLNKETEVIPIYYLKNDNSYIIFNEDQFNEGEKSSDNRVRGFFVIIFLFGLWRICTE